jgi:hypothetical protein
MDKTYHFHLIQTDHERLANVLYLRISLASPGQQGSLRLLKSAT